MKISKRIKWMDETYFSISVFPDWLRATYKISDAFDFKLINWNIFNLAKDKIQRVKNGSWMFENNGK